MKYLPAVLTIGFLLSACGSAPENRYYALSTNAGRPIVETKPGAHRSITLTDVTIPDMLDRPQIVLISGPNSVDVREFDRWAEPLGSMIRRSLAADLAGRLGPAGVLPPGVPVDARIFVSVDRLEADAQGSVTLAGTWTERIGSGTGETISVHPFQHQDHADAKDLTSVAATMSRLLGQLADDIAGAS